MRQTILAIVLVVTLLVIGVVWFGYIRTAPEAAPAGPAQPAVAERLNQYRQLKALQIDTSVFADPLFQSLTRPVSAAQPSAAPASKPPQPGRANPFTPFE